MAETAGLDVGVIALAGLFNNTVECFEFVQLGRTFGKDFQASQLKLDSTRLGLSRWGKYLHLNEDIQNTTSLQGYFKSKSAVKHAEDLLGQIAEMNRTEPQAESLAVYNPQTDLDPAMMTLHDKMRQLALEPKWALYQQKPFRRLIEDMVELVDELVELFPATQQAQRELCDSDVSTISESEGIFVLREIAARKDRLLEQAIVKMKDGADRSRHIVFSGSSRIGLQVGHNSGTMSGFTFGQVS
ncbi:hypothetical protein P154DRAFT_553643 [Amniculicola lignicola CBS 123094]|uniref:Uncharacterized protein n=1 Tax=Amniculicola lignicola CBS 123094 TaxID=1392246 RepID=A0A6A5WJX3_9PLEO|nr:hypothetical protein P154DRAFT_553643 [Amniculicola lignicola CBS 123094]